MLKRQPEGLGFWTLLRPAKSKLRAVLSGTGDLISCDFVPMICDIAPLLTRLCARLGKLGVDSRHRFKRIHGASQSQQTASRMKSGRMTCPAPSPFPGGLLFVFVAASNLVLAEN
jgi:hypothetical protein